MKKKVVSLMLVLSMAAAMFAGCGSSGKDSSKDEAKKDDSKGSVYYLNFKPEVDKQWQKIAKAYTEKNIEIRDCRKQCSYLIPDQRTGWL